MSGVLTLSEHALIKLRNIEQHIAQLLSVTVAHHGAAHGEIRRIGITSDGWKYEKTGKTWFYERLITFAGSTMSIDLSFQKDVQVNVVYQVYSDATARDFDIRIIPAFTDPTAYVKIVSQTGSTNLDRFTQMEYKYPAGSTLRMYYANFTADKTVRVKIQVDEL